MDREPRLRLGKHAAIVAAVLVVFGTALVQLSAIKFECAFDTSYCAHSRVKNTAYVGEFTGVRSPTPFTVFFESRREWPPVAFTTDASGRFCFIWADERITPFARLGHRSDIGVQQRFPVHPGKPYQGCPIGTASVPWNRSDDAGTAWQPLLVYGLGLFALLTLWASALLPIGRRKRLVRSVGLWASAATPLLAVAVWTAAA
jgi:hypothetical protein